MIEEVTRDLYRVEIPLPGNPLKSINSFILKGQERNLIIDTGMNQEECMKAMQSLLKDVEKNIPMEEVRFSKVEDKPISMRCNFRKVCRG